MKDMSNRDKMILVIITIIIILVAGFFALIRPQYNKYMADVDTYNSTKTEYDGIQQKLSAIPTLKDTITSIYNDSKKTAAVFVNEAFADANKNYSDEKTNLAVDEHIQPAIDESSLNIKEMVINGVSDTELEYYYYTPNVVTYSLLEAADVNGNYAADITEKLFSSVILSERETVHVMANTVDLTVEGTKANLMIFLDAIKNDKNAIRIHSLTIDDYMFTGGLDVEEEEPTQAPVPTEPQFDEEGNPIEPTPEATPTPTPTPTPSAGSGEELEGYSQMEISVTFYNAKTIDEPDLGD